MFTAPDQPPRSMGIPMAAILNTLGGDDIDRLNREAIRDLTGG